MHSIDSVMISFPFKSTMKEFGDSTNSVRIELNKLEEAGLLQRQVSGQKMLYQVNKSNPFYFNLVSIHEFEVQ